MDKGGMASNEAPDIGPIIQRERKARHLTLERLAALSGVSRSMLSQIERGESNPTFAVLWGLTQALKIDLGELISDGVAHRRAAPVDVVTVPLTPEIKSPDGAWRLRILSPPGMAGRVEWYEVEIAPGGRLSSSPHAAGTHEHLTAQTDGLRVSTALGQQALAVGETARYRADVDHEIVNEGSEAARALMVVVYE
jgi:transcriptional regulator with XRE-family HTH domain